MYKIEELKKPTREQLSSMSKESLEKMIIDVYDNIDVMIKEIERKTPAFMFKYTVIVVAITLGLVWLMKYV